MAENVKESYLEWMYNLVRHQKYTERKSYRRLFEILYDIEFTYTVDMDVNRYNDGVELRYRFGKTTRCRRSDVKRYLDSKPCSVLEMIVALAVRLEEHIMVDDKYGDRTGTWFWGMIENLGLIDMAYDDRGEEYIRDVVQRFLDHDYDPNGKGGLFTVSYCDQDLRDAEIWYQACWYLDDLIKWGYFE